MSQSVLWGLKAFDTHTQKQERQKAHRIKWTHLNFLLEQNELSKLTLSQGNRTPLDHPAAHTTHSNLGRVSILPGLSLAICQVIHLTVLL